MTPLEKEKIRALETAVWEALVLGDAAADAALLAPDFLGVYETGFGDRDEHVAQLSAGPSVARFALRDQRFLALADNLVLVAYRAVYSRAATPEVEEVMYVSSIWRRNGTDWRNVFSQDTAEGSQRPV